MKRSQSGFTVIELIVVIVLLASASVLFFVQKNNIQVAARDDKRKTAINAIYYNLEEVFYTKNQYYPNKLDAKQLPAMDAALLTDPSGFAINDETGLSNYHYDPINCNGDKCTGYTLRTLLENEADFIKKSRH